MQTLCVMRYLSSEPLATRHLQVFAPSGQGDAMGLVEVDWTRCLHVVVLGSIHFLCLQDIDQ